MNGNVCEVCDWLYYAPLAVVVLGLTLRFIRLFSASIAAADAVRAQIRSWMQFAYVFVFFALVVALLPFMVPQKCCMPAAPVHILTGCVRGTAAPLDSRCAPQPAAANATQWLVTLGGVITPLPPAVGAVAPNVPSFVVEGGLAVPLYVIILSLIGGAISLARRVPEYQKRMSPDYVGTETEPKLSMEQGREYLIFQIVQYLSAPYLAIVAYQLFDPSTRTVAVTTAFAAGFASEPILLLIRALVEKLAPLSLNAKAIGSIAGRVVSGDGTPLRAAQVRLVDIVDSEAKVSAFGQFVFDGVAIGRRTLEVTDGGVSRAFVITVEAGRTTLCDLCPAATTAVSEPDADHEGCGAQSDTPTADHELPAAKGGVANHG